MIPAIKLVIFLIMPGGQAFPAEMPQPDLKTCLEKAGEFLAQDPNDFGAVAMGAGCVIMAGPKADPAGGK
jgi:hypothetical protein